MFLTILSPFTIIVAIRFFYWLSTVGVVFLASSELEGEEDSDEIWNATYSHHIADTAIEFCWRCLFYLLACFILVRSEGLSSD